jgi:molybdopterin-containing oxidoreductase family iron-sulfur binding subunit
MGTNRKYWKGLDELKQTPEFLEKNQNEFSEELSVDQFLADEKLAESSTGRRDFLKFLGFSVAAATLAACEAPVVKAVPYVVKPENITPGMPTWYASSYYDGTTFSSILVKTREGRPIFIKGNKEKGFTKGAINPRISASVLSLYDGERLTDPLIDGAKTTWKNFDTKVTGDLEKAAKSGKKIVLLSNTEISPSTLTVIQELSKKLGGNSTDEVNNADSDLEATTNKNSNVEHIQYDALSFSGIRKANEASFGVNVLPNYDFSKAKTIVSVSADFLNNWLMSNEYTTQYASRRNPDGEWMNKHYQFETNMSVAGSNADVRGMIKPSQIGQVLSILHQEIVGSALPGVSIEINETTVSKIKEAAKELKANKGASLLVCGSNRTSHQIVVNAINNALNNIGKTINFANPVNMFMSEDDKMSTLIKDMNAGKIGAIVMWNTNPVYTHPNGEEFKKGLAKVGTTVAISQYADETATNCKYIAAQSHALESWNDYNPKMNHYAIAQPTIRPLHNTRSVGESLMVWAGLGSYNGKDSTLYYDYIRQVWETYGFPTQTKYLTFNEYWNNAVHNSCADEDTIVPVEVQYIGDVSSAAKDIASIKGGELEVQLYTKTSIGDGTMAGNPWLQEMPDSITKVTWDNYFTMNPSDMKGKYSTDLGQESPSDMATVTVDGVSLTLPVFPQPGQALGTVGVALGYGRGANGEKIGKAAFHTNEYGKHQSGENGGKKAIGANAYAFINNGDYAVYNATIAKANKTYHLACTQTHATVMGRNSIVKETTLDIYKNQDPSAYNHQHTLHSGWNHEEKGINEFSLWDEHPVENVGHRWGMSIDLNSCIGCGSCLISCQAENNVPVVGKDEVRRGREMHWLRLDRYYASDIEPAVGTKGEGFKTEGFDGLQEPAENPKVVHMPMMCHHCNHAPCETVCPVAATTHSNEGLNMMAYNRCIGTRYCGNNCPYKVRRFNWFNYPSYRKFTEVNPAQDDLGRMVLNPDVVVRTRGVMEKCSFCVQKIQTGKLVAKKEGRPVKDGDVTTACSDVCPTNAITVGDWNDPASAVRKSTTDNRAYQALEEIGIKPNVWFKVKVRNEKNDALAAIQTSHGDAHHEEGEHKETEHNDTHASSEEAHH